VNTSIVGQDLHVQVRVRRTFFLCLVLVFFLQICSEDPDDNLIHTFGRRQNLIFSLYARVLSLVLR
jgi:hypothetical protein